MDCARDHGPVIANGAPMKPSIVVTAALAALAMAGCQKASEPAPRPSAGAKGRYVGVGIYAPGQMWEQLVRPVDRAVDPTGATLRDDEQIIVVLDSATGELRQCGNLSGHCIGLNPWARPLPAGDGLPAALRKHAQELSAEAEAANPTQR